MQPKNQDQDWAWKSYSRSGGECQINSEIKTKKEGGITVTHVTRHEKNLDLVRKKYVIIYCL